MTTPSHIARGMHAVEALPTTGAVKKLLGASPLPLYETKVLGAIS